MTLRACAALLVGAMTLAGCGDGGETAESASQIPAAADSGVTGFDLYVAASEEGRIQFADVYGITLQPLRAYRITTDKRISAISASADKVVVAAADEQIDQLGELSADGLIRPIPGLGRPHAFNPQVLPSGNIRFLDANGEGENPNRFLEWDPNTSRQKVLRSVGESTYLDFGTGPEGVTFQLLEGNTKRPQIKIFGSKKTTTYPLPAESGSARWGKDQIAVQLRMETGAAFPTPVGALILNPDTGKQVTVNGWSPIGWSPDGAKLFVQRTGGAAGAPSELGVLDSTDPQSVRSLGSIPYLEIYGGSWVRGEPKT